MKKEKADATMELKACAFGEGVEHTCFLLVVERETLRPWIEVVAGKYGY